jgi:23S rRNA pseudouridine2605 synthase
MASPKKPVTKKPVTKKTAKSKKIALPKPVSTEPKLAAAPVVEVPKLEDPIGNETDGEAKTTVEQATEKLETESVLYQGTTSVVPHEQLIGDRALAPEGSIVPEGGGGFNPRIKPKKSARALAPEIRSETKAEAEDGSESEDEPKFTPQPRPPAKLERLQKILAAAGVASRRGAEAMIEQGRVQLNGKVVTVLGTKADATRDHIRVDGKLLQGPERHRYFVLNKPRGFVTTVKDPEGRPTVMQFFSKFSERLYPVGRLDYLSEGLLVVTNDGELANRLTKASSGVEKTYLVKVSGQPTEAELNILRSGVSIERGKPGSPPVRTSPARIRQVRQGDNPWYEVVLIEGRNRELRKMFEEVGHFVEKIRRTGYGPLVLDQEPGSLRELEPAELDALRQAAEGTLRTPKSKDLRRRNLLDSGQLPTVLPKPSGRPSRSEDSFASGAANKLFRPARPSDFPPKKFGADRAPRPAGSFDKGAAKPFRPTWKKEDRPTRPPTRFAAGSTAEGRPSAPRPFTAKPAWKKDARPTRPPYNRPSAGRSFDRPSARPVWKKDDRPTRPPTRFAPGSATEGRPSPGRPFSAKPAWKKPERPTSDRSGPTRPTPNRFGSNRPAARPIWKKDDRSARPPYNRPAASRREAPVFDEDLGPIRPPNLHIEEITGPDRPFSASSGKPRGGGTRPSAPRPYSDRPRTSFERPASSSRPASKPFRGEGGQSRPFTTSSGKPRAGGARPSSKPFRPGAPADRSSSGGWKPKTRYGPGKPASRAHSKPKPGGFSNSGYKAKPGGKKR